MTDDVDKNFFFNIAVGIKLFFGNKKSKMIYLLITENSKLKNTLFLVKKR